MRRRLVTGQGVTRTATTRGGVLKPIPARAASTNPSRRPAVVAFEPTPTITLRGAGSKPARTWSASSNPAST